MVFLKIVNKKLIGAPEMEKLYMVIIKKQMNLC